MAAPLVVNGVARGALVGHGREPGCFGQPQIELLTALASLAGVALENARLHEETGPRPTVHASSPTSRGSSAPRSTCRTCCAP